jgi:hypothetical protein
MNIFAGSFGVGRISAYRKLRAIRKGLNQFPFARQLETSRVNAMYSKQRPSAIMLISSNDSPRKSSGSSFRIPTLRLCSTVNVPLEVLFTARDAHRAGPDRADPESWVHLLPAVESILNNALGNSSPPDRRPKGEPLVHDLPVLDSPSVALNIWAVDVDSARVEGILQGARLAMGPVCQNPAHVAPAGRAARFQARGAKALKLAWWILTGRYRIETR